MKFDQLKIGSELLRSVFDRGYTVLTDVQEQTLAHSLQGIDVAVQSQTGTGKTAAFLITLFNRLQSDRASGKNSIVIVPTRELAVQIEKEARMLSRHLDVKIGTFYGGVGYAGQLALLRKRLDLVIGTPGRLLDFCNKGNLKLKNISVLVIDEADRLLDMGFLPDIKKLIRQMPPSRMRQSMLFSATLNRTSGDLAREFMNKPEIIELTPDQMTVEAISQEIFHVPSHIKVNLMLGLLKQRSPRNALIFTNMRYVAQRLSTTLKRNGFNSHHLTGALTQSKRLKVINDFKAGKFPLLVATDVAARGLQIDDLDLVINYDLPQDHENYVHRIGRTARAGKTGNAISFASEGSNNHLIDIESYIGMRIPVKKAGTDLYAIDQSLGADSERKPKRQNNRKQFRPQRSHGKKAPRFKQNRSASTPA